MIPHVAKHMLLHKCWQTDELASILGLTGANPRDQK